MTPNVVDLINSQITNVINLSNQKGYLRFGERNYPNHIEQVQNDLFKLTRWSFDACPNGSLLTIFFG
jgi:hypothetical protein